MVLLFSQIAFFNTEDGSGCSGPEQEGPGFKMKYQKGHNLAPDRFLLQIRSTILLVVAHQRRDNLV